MSHSHAGASDHQARKLLAAPDAETIKPKVRDFRHARNGVPHLRVSGKGGKTHYLPLHPGTHALIHDHLDAAGHGHDDAGVLYRAVRNNRTVPQMEADKPLEAAVGSKLCRKVLVIHSASARLRSSCSKALAIRVISADRVPTALAVSRQVAVAVATSLIIARACGSVSAKNADAASSRSSEHVPSSRSIFVVSTRALRSVGTGLRPYAGERDQPAFPSQRKP